MYVSPFVFIVSVFLYFVYRKSYNRSEPPAFIRDRRLSSETRRSYKEFITVLLDFPGIANFRDFPRL